MSVPKCALDLGFLRSRYTRRASPYSPVPRRTVEGTVETAPPSAAPWTPAGVGRRTSLAQRGSQHLDRVRDDRRVRYGTREGPTANRRPVPPTGTAGVPGGGCARARWCDGRRSGSATSCPVQMPAVTRRTTVARIGSARQRRGPFMSSPSDAYESHGVVGFGSTVR